MRMIVCSIRTHRTFHALALVWLDGLALLVFVQAGSSCSGRREGMLNQRHHGFLNRQWSFRCWSWSSTNIAAGAYDRLSRHLPSSSHSQNFRSNCFLRSIIVLKRSQEIGLCRHPARIPQMWREVVVRKLNTRKELSKATETSEKSRFFRGAPKTKTTPTVRGRLHLFPEFCPFRRVFLFPALLKDFAPNVQALGLLVPTMSWRSF